MPTDFMVVAPPPQKPTPKTVETKPDLKEPLQNNAQTTQQFHTVGSGETIYKICSKYNITEQQLRSLNNIKGDHIEIGQKLRVK
jgi:membrane-bound lytic murein transglycosylase D